jgi:hypothetical protein
MRRTLFALSCILACARIAAASPIVLYSNLSLDGRMAAASRPASPGNVEIEAADDFLAGGPAITEIKFIGLITGGASIQAALTNLEFYRVFPNDSTTPPDTRVPTRTNSPSDNAFTELAFTDLKSLTTTQIATNVTEANSVKNGINPVPFQQTNGEGPVTGTEVLFDAVLKTPLALPGDHFFFVPQIAVSPGGDFYWMSASRPILPPGTPFAPDLQAWIRNEPLSPDWLRIGTDIVGGGATAPQFNMAFELDTDTSVIPEPGALLLVATGLGLVARRRRVRRIRE